MHCGGDLVEIERGWESRGLAAELKFEIELCLCESYINLIYSMFASSVGRSSRIDVELCLGCTCGRVRWCPRVYGPILVYYLLCGYIRATCALIGFA